MLPLFVHRIPVTYISISKDCSAGSMGVKEEDLVARGSPLVRIQICKYIAGYRYIIAGFEGTLQAQFRNGPLVISYVDNNDWKSIVRLPVGWRIHLNRSCA